MMHLFKNALLAFAVIGLTAPAATFAQPLTTANASYVLGPDDEIEVSVFGQNDLKTKTRIKADGTILMPLIGTVQAADMTTDQLSKSLVRSFERGGYLLKPSVTVEVTTYASKTVTVLGIVNSAGLYPIDRPYSAAAMIAKAGGATKDGANVVIVTPAGSKESRRLSFMTSPGATDYMVQPGDTLFVPPAEMIYVYGQVNDPGAVAFVPGMTFRQAMAKAGGPTVAGSTRKYSVTRAGKRIKPDLDEQVQPEDVLNIKEKLF